MIYVKTNADGAEYPAMISGKMVDREWDNRESKAVTLEMTYAEAAEIFVDGLSWSIVQREIVPVEDAQGALAQQEQVEQWDNSDFCVAGTITDNRDGTVTCKMGKKTASDVLAELEAAYDGN